MAKKKKKKKKSSDFNALQAEKSAANAVESENYRKAQSLYRKLTKHDRSKFQPKLISVQERLLEQLIVQKKWNNVAPVLAGLQKIAPDNALSNAVEIRMALAGGQFRKAGEHTAQWLSTERISSIENFYLADSLVLAFLPSDAYPSLPESVGTDLDRIHAAIDAVGGQAVKEALAHIKHIGLRSLFSEWKWYIKGVCAYYSHEDQKALTAFRKLTKGSTPEKAAKAYRILLKESGEKLSPTTPAYVHQGISILSGEEALAEPLARGEHLWNVGRYSDSFKHIKSRLPEFPSQAPGIREALTSFYFRAAKQIPYAKAEVYLESLVKTALKNPRGNHVEKFKATQAMALWMDDEDAFDEDLLDVWEEALHHFRTLTPNKKLAEALVYGHLGQIFSEEDPDDTFFNFGLIEFKRSKKRKNLRNAELAEKCLLKAVDAAPDSLEAYFALLNLYEKTTDTSKINQTLDKIITIFPDEKNALHKAGLRCAARKALIKAMKYLERALLLDPIDRTLREDFIIVCIQAAHSYVDKRNLKKCLDVLQKAEAQASPTAKDFNRGLCYLYVHWSAILHRFNQSNEAHKRLDKALSLCDSSVKLHYFAGIIARHYDLPPKLFKESRDLMRKVRSHPLEPDHAVILVEVLSYGATLSDEYLPWLYDEVETTNRYLGKSVKKPFILQQVKTIVDYALNEKTYDVDLAQKYIRLALKESPDNARFRWLKLVSEESEGFPSIPPKEYADELDKIAQLAEEQRDPEVVKAVREKLQRIENAFKVLGDFIQSIDYDFEEDDFWDDDDDMADDF